jgi:hypothetical protein
MRFPKDTKIIGMRTASGARALLEKLEVNWEYCATLRLGNHWDAIAGAPREQLGACGHFITDKNELVASYSQTNGALWIYPSPQALGKMFLKQYNIMRRGQRWA